MAVPWQQILFKSIEFEEWSTQSVASYKQGYGNNEHVATAWLLSVELKCWFLAQLVSSTLTISASLSYSLQG